MKIYTKPEITFIKVETESILQGSRPGQRWSDEDQKWYYIDPYAEDDWDKGKWH